MNRSQPPYTLIKNKKELAGLAEELKKEPDLGVDLEADSLFHYQEKVCLLQVSTSSRDFIIDPLSLNGLTPLAPVFSDPHIRKVFHGADYDMRSLYRDFRIEVNNLFDTQIAASFLGMTETGLAALLKKILGVNLDKTYQKKDWSKRPLPRAMLAYAVHDTSHLLELSRILERELRGKKRLSWVEEECERLSRVRPLPADENPFFTKFKNARRLDARGLAILESILELRDDLARRRDRPPFKILGNETIMEIALVKPGSKKDLENIKGMSPGQVTRLGGSILKRVSEGLARPSDQLPAFPKKVWPRTGPEVKDRIKQLKAWRERRSKEMSIDPALLCTNAQIESLARTLPPSRRDLEKTEILRKWQTRLYGSEILSLLN